MKSAGKIRFHGAPPPSNSLWLLIKVDLVVLLGFLCGPDSHSESLCPHQVLFFVGGFFTLVYTYQSVSAVVHPHANFSPTLFPLVQMILMEVQLGRKVLFAERCLCSLSCCLLCSSALQIFDTNQRETGWVRSCLRMLGGRFHWKHSRSWSYLDHSCATLVLN